MQATQTIRWAVVATAACLSTASTRAFADDDDRARAVALRREFKEIEALPLLEKLYRENPNDRGVKDMLACSLVSKAAVCPAAERSAILKRARTLFKELEATGEMSNLAHALLECIPEGDQAIAEFSPLKPVNDAMQAAEEAFAHRDFATALTHYQKALALDPRLYAGCVGAGDAYFCQKKWDEAVLWFRRAQEIDPDRAIAFRYCGDALSAQGKEREARECFLLAIAAEPYTRRPWLSLSQWATKVGVGPRPVVLLPVMDGGREPKESDGTARLAVYEKTRAEWRKTTFAKRFPPGAAYRDSLAEQLDAFRALASALDADAKAGKIKSLDPALANLVALEKEGLLEARLMIHPPDAGVAEDYPSYRATHRPQIMRYLREYVAPTPEKP